ncbi:hypothetical protein P4131_22100 [Pseudomonas aeruginosa]|nr:hypothetical protein [Pseudomonas aeruginosa]
MKATWRCLLPPLSEFAEAAPLHCLRLDARGAVQERIEASLAELARRRQGCRWRCSCIRAIAAWSVSNCRRCLRRSSPPR